MGCQSAHGVPTEGQSCWSFNGDFEKPTLTPSVKVTHGGGSEDHPTFSGCAGEFICHCFITNGQIQFLEDCGHGLANCTVAMIDVEDHMVPDNWPAGWDHSTGWRPTDEPPKLIGWHGPNWDVEIIETENP